LLLICGQLEVAFGNIGSEGCVGRPLGGVAFFAIVWLGRDSEFVVCEGNRCGRGFFRWFRLVELRSVDVGDVFNFGIGIRGINGRVGGR